MPSNTNMWFVMREANEEKYVLTLEPLTMTVLSQMASILATSLFIMLILAFVFWFLIHTMLKQKTLDEMKSDFTNNITHESEDSDSRSLCCHRLPAELRNAPAS